MKLNQNRKSSLLDEWFLRTYESLEKPALPILVS
jgi:hypothetical protein